MTPFADVRLAPLWTPAVWAARPTIPLRAEASQNEVITASRSVVPSEPRDADESLTRRCPTSVIRLTRVRSRKSRSQLAAICSRSVRGAGETIFWLPEHRALIPGDRILGAPGGGVRLCPESWLRYLSSNITRAELRTRLWPLLDLPVERVLCSHGNPVLRNGGEALHDALAAG